MAGTLTWYGPRISQLVRDAASEAIAETMEIAAERAAGTVRAEDYETGAAERSVREHPRPVRTEGSRVIGTWGSRLWRFIFIEVGTVKLAGNHHLRRAADGEYPRLAARIRGRLR